MSEVLSKANEKTFWEDVKSNRRTLFVFIPYVFLYATSYFQRSAVPGTTFNYFQSSLGLSATQVTWLGASFTYVYAAMQLVIGLLADKYGGLRVLRVAGFIYCLGALGFGIQGFPSVGANIYLLCFCRCLIGFGASAMFLGLVKEVDRVFERQNFSVFLGIVYFVGYSGGFFSTFPFAFCCRYYDCMQLLFALGGFSCVLFAMIVIFYKMVPPAEIKRQLHFSFQPFISILRQRKTWLPIYCFCVAFGCNSVIQQVFGMKFLQDYGALAPETASMLLSAQFLVSMFALLGCGIVVKAIGNRRKPLCVVSAFLTLLATLLMFCSIMFRLHVGFFVFAYCMYALANGFSISFSFVIQEVVPQKYMTSSTGLQNGFGYFVVAMSSLLCGKLLDMFIKPEQYISGRLVVYPNEAYLLLFVLLLIPTGISFALSFFTTETYGKRICNEE